MHATYQRVLAIADSTPEPEHAHEGVNRCQEEKELAQLHQTYAYLYVIILHELQCLVELLLFDHVVFLLGFHVVAVLWYASLFYPSFSVFFRP